MRHVILLHDITAEGVRIPAGTRCEVESECLPMLDLRAVVNGKEALFWVHRYEVEDVLR